MLSNLKHKVRDSLISRRVWIDQAAPIAEVRELIRELRPQANGRGLVRFGPKGDGGYLLPDDLDGVTACISPGVSTEAGFDLAVAERGIDVYLADASVKGSPVQHERFHFTPKFLDIYSSDTTVTLDEFCRDKGDEGDLILQMDIEGAEYRVPASVSDALLRRFRIMVIEFHDVDHAFSPVYFREIEAVFRKLQQTHVIVHLHPNNNEPLVRSGDVEIAPGLEVTLYRKDRDTCETRPMTFPHPLDADCAPDQPTVTLPKCWQP